MSAAKYFVKNRSKGMASFNLVSVGNKGRRLSLILSRNETSRALTQEELNSPEVQNGLKAHDLLDVTANVSV